jgi:hypothetical protein
MKDKDFLYWLADRLVNVYGESPNIDFVSKLVSVAESMSQKRHTPNTKTYVAFKERIKGRAA